MVAVMISESVIARTMMMTSMINYCHLYSTAWGVLAVWTARTRNVHVHPDKRITLSLHCLRACALHLLICGMIYIFFV